MVLIIRKKTAVIVILALLTSLMPSAYAVSWPEVTAERAILMTSDGTVLFEKNADTKSLIASTTKLMTAIVVLENARLGDEVTITPGCCDIEGSGMGIKPGERYTVRELLLGLLLASGNDAAEALAAHTAGSVKDFVKLMNSKAKELGMTSTSFANPHGLDAEGHYSTARDMAKLMLLCMENEDFVQLCGTETAEISGHYYVNHNKLLNMLSGCVAGKTGYTKAAGRCLVSCCIRKGMELVCVTLSSPDDWNDHISLYETAFSRYSMRCVTEDVSFRIPVLSGAGIWAELVPGESVTLLVPADREISLRCEYPGFVFAPIEAGERAGRAEVMIDGKSAGEFELVYAYDVPLAVPCAE